jgi:hypothetical protein
MLLTKPLCYDLNLYATDQRLRALPPRLLKHRLRHLSLPLRRQSAPQALFFLFFHFFRRDFSDIAFGIYRCPYDANLRKQALPPLVFLCPPDFLLFCA